MCSRLSVANLLQPCHANNDCIESSLFMLMAHAAAGLVQYNGLRQGIADELDLTVQQLFQPDIANWLPKCM